MYVNMQRNSKWNVFPTPAVRLIIFIQFDFKVINSKESKYPIYSRVFEFVYSAVQIMIML